MSLFMPYEKMWDMPMDPTVLPEEKHVPRWFVWLTIILTFIIQFVAFRTSSTHKERPVAYKGKGLVMVCNHACYVDPYFVILKTFPKIWVRFMAKDDMFGNGGGLGGQCMSRTGAFPVKRDSADRTSIKRAVKHLKNGEIVGVFPEGTRRNKCEYVASLHSGAAFIANMANVPLMPVGISNNEKVIQNGRIHLPHITVHFGEALRIEDFDFLPRKERLEACMWFLMRESHAMSFGLAPEEVDMKELYPDSPDYAETFKDFVPASRKPACEPAAAENAADAVEAGEGE